MKTIIASLAAAAACWATPALADDWALSCQFPGDGLELVIRYDAGWPRHTVEVRRPGRSGLPADHGRPVGRIMTGTGFLLFSQEGIGAQGKHFLLELDSAAMTAEVHIGGGVSWDYLRLTGGCRDVTIGADATGED
jgi:hypothetical protein